MALSNKEVYVVLGMARSGTSAISSGLAALGVSFGNKLDKPDALWNPKGFWEDLDIVFKINRRLLDIIGNKWENTSQNEQIFEGNIKIDSLHVQAKEILNQKFENLERWAFKDPRTALLLPFWQKVFAECELKANYIITLRHPLASAHSLNRVAGIHLEQGLISWTSHLYQAIKFTQGGERILVDYDLMMENSEYQLQRMNDALGLNASTATTAIQNFTQKFLDKQLQHYRFSTNDTNENALKVVNLSSSIYKLLNSVARDEIDFNSSAFAEKWLTIENEYKNCYHTYCYMDSLNKTNKDLSRQIRAMHKSIPWKLIYPLRKIDDYLRSRRINKREMKKLSGN